MMHSTSDRRVWQLASPQRDTRASSPPIGPVARTQLNSPHDRENDAQPPCLPSTVGCVRWVMAMDANMYSLSAAQAWLQP
jgi:hypothetical protein